MRLSYPFHRKINIGFSVYTAFFTYVSGIDWENIDNILSERTIKVYRVLALVVAHSATRKSRFVLTVSDHYRLVRHYGR